jgi:uncharacterized membrane protein (DUF485 family)
MLGDIVLFEGRFQALVVLFNLLSIIFSMGFGIWSVAVAALTDLKTQTISCDVVKGTTFMKVFAAMEFLACIVGIVTWYWGANAEDDSRYENVDNPVMKRKLERTALKILDISRFLARVVSLGVMIALAVVIFSYSCASDSPVFYNQAGTIVKWEFGLHWMVQVIYVIIMIIALCVKLIGKLLKKRRLARQAKLEAMATSEIEIASDVEEQNK